ncbi:hypothetical protein SapgrDRAFT_1920 [Saprospira grandis DSM 2844]|uniref:Gliding motility-associated lipoprotein GldH n=1 Tax=Saprospira grandis DSM 2844 TaxID=694433 RepID=J0P7X2_9BACT|nr:hypothetical protein [Saprospira grandis]EJF53612.1 hypothetical protein SapgrDRAFT_1920 [Saprospira grandis DSM 2844]
MPKLYPLLILALLLSACQANKKLPSQTPQKTAFVPSQKGTVWTYRYTFHNQEKEPIEQKLELLQTEQKADGLYLDLNQAKWMLRNDSLFVRCQGRGGGEFLAPLYLPTADSCTYNTCKGDVFMQVEAKRLPPKEILGKRYEDRFSYQIGPYERVEYARGLGLTLHQYFGIGQKLETQMELIDFQLGVGED